MTIKISRNNIPSPEILHKQVMGLNNLTILNEVPLKVHEFPQQSGYMCVYCCCLFVGDFACLLWYDFASSSLGASLRVYSNKAPEKLKCFFRQKSSCGTHSDYKRQDMCRFPIACHWKYKVSNLWMNSSVHAASSWYWRLKM